MKSPALIKSLSLLLLFIISFAPFSMAQTHQLATFNIRWDNPGDTGNLWKDRAPHVASLIQFHKIGIVGTQEGLKHQIEQLSNSLGFDYLGVGRDDGAQKGEYTAILYDGSQYELLDQGTFWLSPTPEVPSKGWDAALNRICSWGKFKSAEKEEFYVFNIHYDHIGQEAREESSKLVIQKIEEINTEKLPVVLLGDFNVTPDNAAYTTITSSDGWKDARLISRIPSYGPSGTFTGFDWEKMPDGIIDHIFVKGQVQVIRHGILTDNYGKKYPSDHFPVMVEVQF
ncbi:endonuclease/exonuclease/phosphatase family protein [uncultured Algoriphagus sp.]|uniref:endonuclease/exonuclease/phosphatase family protein n=1 Tax=uncultured Algoriphagus sp. TaxID=417365 RepID=UPI00258ACC53|nr:endonuclease/exonuclease/phosphatase family protein [uncultured Algoriphagus sp.]